MVDWNKYLYHRLLLTEYRNNYSSLIEAKVIEVSLEGRVKFKFITGTQAWREKDYFVVVEDLG